ncbi:MAG: hypothetical protein WCK63_15560 [Betaproteobacteria bacterium]
MSWIAKLGIILVAASNGLTQAVPAIHESQVGSPCQNRVHSLGSLNFDELNLCVDSKTFRLHKGVYDHFAPGQGGLRYELFGKWLIQADGSHSEFALIYFIETAIGASSSQTGFIQLLALERGQLLLKQEFRFIPKGENAGCAYEAKAGTLRITAKSDDSSPAFAPKSVDRAVYTWTGIHFKLSEWHAIPSTRPPS